MGVSRVIRGSNRFLDFAASVPLVRDELQRLEATGTFKWFDAPFASRSSWQPELLEVETDGVPIRVTYKPYSEDEKRNGVWKHLEGDLRSFGLPYRFVVWIPLQVMAVRGRASEGVPKPRSIKCQALLSAFGIGVKVRFGFSDLDPKALIGWSRRDLSFTVGNPKLAGAWKGDVADVLWLALRAAVQALGDRWAVLPRDSWKESLKVGIKKIYTEIAETGGNDRGQAPAGRVLFGLGSFRHDFESLTRHYWESRSFVIGPDHPSARRMGEKKVFTPEGAGLYLLYSPEDGNWDWRAANCFRRDVVYSLMLHNALVEQVQKLFEEMSKQDEKSETRGVRTDDLVASVARSRLRALVGLQDRHLWLCHYTRRRRTAERLGELSHEIRGRICDERTLKRLLRQVRPERWVDLPANEGSEKSGGG